MLKLIVTSDTAENVINTILAKNSSLNFKNLHLDLKPRKGFHKVKGFDENLSIMSFSPPGE